MALALVAARAVVRSMLPPLCTRAFSMEGLKGFSESEKALEDLYFTKEDERLLRKVLGKVKTQSDKSDKHAATGMRAAEEASLKEIVGKYGISKEDMDKLIDWKHTAF